MADEDKAKTAKERLAAAKKAAEDAEVVAENAADTIEDAADAKDAVADVAESAADKVAETAESAADKVADTAADAVEDATPSVDGEPSDGGTEEKPEEAFVDVASEDPPEAPPAAPPPPKPSRPWSAVALQWIVLFLAGVVFALFAAPRVAPYLPASVAELLSPRGDGLEEALAAASAENDAALAALTERLDVAEAALAAQDEASEAARAEIAATLEPRIAAAEAAKTDTTAFETAVDDVAGRVTQAEAALEGLKAEVSGLAGFTGESAAPSAETLERVAAFGASVEGLRAEVAALSEATAGIDRAASNADLAALAARVDALEGGQAATAGAEQEAQRIRGSARLDAALTRINRALISGAPFAEQLETAETISGVEPAPGLAAAASTGVATVDALARSFQDAAQDGYAAALADEAGDGVADRMFAAVQGRIGGRPSVETEGDDVGAVLSRIEARLRDGDVEAARTEAGGLSDAAIGAMSGWLATLETTADARAGFDAFRAALATN